MMFYVGPGTNDQEANICGCGLPRGAAERHGVRDVVPRPDPRPDRHPGQSLHRPGGMEATPVGIGGTGNVREGSHKCWKN